jgi:predicted Zn-ribbon and HTH transcriptional regulator
MPTYKCKRCGYVWIGGRISNHKIIKPRYCPKCKSPNCFRSNMQRKRIVKYRG